MQVVVIDGIKIRGRGNKISTNLILGERAWGLTHKKRGSNIKVYENKFTIFFRVKMEIEVIR